MRVCLLAKSWLLAWLWTAVGSCCPTSLETCCPDFCTSQPEEIFMASRLKVYVGLAHTLAPAGKCTARTARCSDAEDEASTSKSPKESKRFIEKT